MSSSAFPLRATSAAVRAAHRARRSAPLPGFAVPAVAFGLDLTASAALTATDAGPVVGAAVLVALAAIVGAGTTSVRAAAVGAFGWLFWSGFVVHDAGRLGFDGYGDVLAVTCLVAGAFFTSLAAERYW